MKETFYNIVSGLFSKLVITGLTLVFVPIYIEFIGVESYGVVGIYTSIVGAIFLFDFGISNIISKELSQRLATNHCKKSTIDFLLTIEIIYLLIGLFLGSIIWIFSSLIVEYWITIHVVSDAELIFSLKLIALAVATQWPHSFYTSALFGRKKQLTFNMIYIIFSILKIVGAYILLKYWSATIVAYLWWSIITSLLLTLILRWALWRELSEEETRPRFNLSEVKKIQKLTIGMSAIGLVIFFVSDFDKFLMVKILSLRDFGYYSMAFIIPSGFLMLGTSIKNSLFPNISEDIISKEGTQIKQKYHHYTQIVYYLITPLSMLVIFFSKEIVFLWTNNSETSLKISSLVIFLTLGSMINGYTMIIYSYIIVREKTKFLFYQNLICAIVALPVLFILLHQIGLMAAGIYWLLFNLLQYVFLVLYFHVILYPGEIKSYLWNDVALPILISITVIVPFKYFVSTYIINVNYFYILFLIILTLIFIFTVLVKKEFKNLLKIKYSNFRGK